MNGLRITLIAFGSRGDVTPLVAFGRQLHEAGHHVVLVSHAEFAPLASDHHLKFVPVGANYHDFVATPEGRAALGIPRNSPLGCRALLMPFLASAADVFEQCWHATSDADALVCSGIATPVGAHIAARRRLPIALAQVVPAIKTRNFAHPFMPPWRLGRFYNRGSYAIANLLIGYGNRDVLDVWRRTAERLGGPSRYAPRVVALIAASPVLVPRPTDWPAHVHVTGFWSIPGGTQSRPPADLDEFISAGAPPLAIGFGSTIEGQPDQLRQIVSDTLDALDMRAVIVAGSGGALSGFGASHRILQVSFADYDWLFPRVRVIVHQGGVGTAAFALRAGHPQVAIPYGLDQAFWASRLRAIGVTAFAISRHRLATRGLTAAIQRVMHDRRFADAARRARTSIDAEPPGVEMAARLAIQHFENSGR